MIAIAGSIIIAFVVLFVIVPLVLAAMMTPYEMGPQPPQIKTKRDYRIFRKGSNARVVLIFLLVCVLLATVFAVIDPY